MKKYTYKRFKKRDRIAKTLNQVFSCSICGEPYHQYGDAMKCCDGNIVVVIPKSFIK